ncbi:hypothetical protein SOVF_103680 [Spinacia oleracea]|nr:hypothetical protein SOVF_103680 [Spinacia oleracea]
MGILGRNRVGGDYKHHAGVILTVLLSSKSAARHA